APSLFPGDPRTSRQNAESPLPPARGQLKPCHNKRCMNPPSPSNRATAVGILCGIGAALFWAAGFVVVRHGINLGFTPADLTFHRCFWSGLLLLPLAWRDGLADLNGVGWGRGVLLTILGG